MKTIRVSTLVLASIVMATGLFAQTPPPAHDHSAQKPAPTGKPGMMDDKMMAHCVDMMQKHDQMKADFKAEDAKLDDLVTKMNTSTGADRVEAMGAVVTELSAQHKAQRTKTEAMQSDMMKHMMEHMQSGKPMSMCPMMAKMQGAPGDTKPVDHSGHHQP